MDATATATVTSIQKRLNVSGKLAAAATYSVVSVSSALHDAVRLAAQRQMCKKPTATDHKVLWQRS
jgi:hypothetical protein